MWDTFACATAKFLTHFIISIAVLENVPPEAGFHERATFSTLNVGLAGTGTRNRTWPFTFGHFFLEHSVIHQLDRLNGVTKEGITENAITLVFFAEPEDART
jgi:hypothetical protein